MGKMYPPRYLLFAIFPPQEASYWKAFVLFVVEPSELATSYRGASALFSSITVGDL